MKEPRRGQAPRQLSRSAFGERYPSSLRDPAFAAANEAPERIEQIAWLVALPELVASRDQCVPPGAGLLSFARVLDAGRQSLHRPYSVISWRDTAKPGGAIPARSPGHW